MNWKRRESIIAVGGGVGGVWGGRVSRPPAKEERKTRCSRTEEMEKKEPSSWLRATPIGINRKRVPPPRNKSPALPKRGRISLGKKALSALERGAAEKGEGAFSGVGNGNRHRCKPLRGGGGDNSSRYRVKKKTLYRPKCSMKRREFDPGREQPQRPKLDRLPAWRKKSTLSVAQQIGKRRNNTGES